MAMAAAASAVEMGLGARGAAGQGGGDGAASGAGGAAGRAGAGSLAAMMLMASPEELFDIPEGEMPLDYTAGAPLEYDAPGDIPPGPLGYAGDVPQPGVLLGASDAGSASSPWGPEVGGPGGSGSLAALHLLYGGRQSSLSLSPLSSDSAGFSPYLPGPSAFGHNPHGPTRMGSNGFGAGASNPSTPGLPTERHSPSGMAAERLTSGGLGQGQEANHSGPMSGSSSLQSPRSIDAALAAALGEKASLGDEGGSSSNGRTGGSPHLPPLAPGASASGVLQDGGGSGSLAAKFLMQHQQLQQQYHIQQQQPLPQQQQQHLQQQMHQMHQMQQMQQQLQFQSMHGGRPAGAYPGRLMLPPHHSTLERQVSIDRHVGSDRQLSSMVPKEGLQRVPSGDLGSSLAMAGMGSGAGGGTGNHRARRPTNGQPSSGGTPVGASRLHRPSNSNSSLDPGYAGGSGDFQDLSSPRASPSPPPSASASPSPSPSPRNRAGLPPRSLTTSSSHTPRHGTAAHLTSPSTSSHASHSSTGIAVSGQAPGARGARGGSSLALDLHVMGLQVAELEEDIRKVTAGNNLSNLTPAQRKRVELAARELLHMKRSLAMATASAGFPVPTPGMPAGAPGPIPGSAENSSHRTTSSGSWNTPSSQEPGSWTTTGSLEPQLWASVQNSAYSNNGGSMHPSLSSSGSMHRALPGGEDSLRSGRGESSFRGASPGPSLGTPLSRRPSGSIEELRSLMPGVVVSSGHGIPEAGEAGDEPPRMSPREQRTTQHGRHYGASPDGRRT